MRIAYGVMGYGRGHAMRTMSVLPALMAEHEVTVFAGGDAYPVDVCASGAASGSEGVGVDVEDLAE